MKNKKTFLILLLFWSPLFLCAICFFIVLTLKKMYLKWFLENKESSLYTFFKHFFSLNLLKELEGVLFWIIIVPAFIPIARHWPDVTWMEKLVKCEWGVKTVPTSSSTIICWDTICIQIYRYGYNERRRRQRCRDTILYNMYILACALFCFGFSTQKWNTF